MPVLEARTKAIEMLDESARLVQAVERDQDILFRAGQTPSKSFC